MKLDELNIHDIGNTIQLAGAIYADGETVYLVPLPDELTAQQSDLIDWLTANQDYPGEATLAELDMDQEDWVRFLRQTDLLEVEVLAHAGKNGNRGLVKAIIRKSQRQIDQRVSWAVYRRDGYRCRYCGRDDVPLTVDHLVLWEEGGPSTEENLVAACKKCNKKRGNLPYEKWLRHPYYRDKSRNLIMAAIAANEEVLNRLDQIPRRAHKPSKR